MVLPLTLVLTLYKTVVVAMPQPASEPVELQSLERVFPELPTARPHPLPPSLAQWNDVKAGDYFDQVRSTPVGALIWSRFPIQVYVQPAETVGNSFTVRRSQMWVKAVENAIREWNMYLPLTQVEQSKDADITIWRASPPLRFEPSKDTQTSDRRPLTISRARSAETLFELYARPSLQPKASPALAHRMKIYIRPDQADSYLEAAARHELGHALGIWGHSPKPTDALYFSQVRNPAKISARDINTLKRVYKQPTRLGWEMNESQKESVGEDSKL